MKPTKEQEQKFWEWCILNLLELPDLDLNNLFKYAVPKLNEAGLKLRMLGQKRDKKTYFCAVGGNNLPRGYEEDKDPALALFWAIYKVIV